MYIYVFSFSKTTTQVRKSQLGGKTTYVYLLMVPVSLNLEAQVFLTKLKPIQTFRKSSKILDTILRILVLSIATSQVVIYNLRTITTITLLL